MAAQLKKSAVRPASAGEIKKIFRFFAPRPHVVTFVLGDHGCWLWRSRRLFAVPGSVHARVGDWILFYGIDAGVKLAFNPQLKYVTIPSDPPLFKSMAKSVFIIRIEPGTPVGAYEYTAESAAYGPAIGNSPPKIIIYD